MTLQSRTQPSVRAEDYGRGNAVTFQYAEWTDHERRLNRIREDMMIRFWPNSVPDWLRRTTTRENSMLAHYEANQARILQTIETPMTADQVAAECQLSRETVTNHLIRLVKDGKAQWAHPPNGPDGRMVPRIYSQMPRPENAGRQAAIERGMATERQVLDAFTGRHAAFEIAEQTGISRKTVQRVFAKLAENGIIVESGQTFNSRGMPVKTWVKT